MNQSGENIKKITGVCRWCESLLDSECKFDSFCSEECKKNFRHWVEKEHAGIRGKRPQYWNVIRRFILERDKYQCQVCGSTEKLSVHHIIPLSEGGDSTATNLRVLCQGCHQRAHGKRVVKTQTKKRYRIRIRYQPMYVPALLASGWLWNEQTDIVPVRDIQNFRIENSPQCKT